MFRTIVCVVIFHQQLFRLEGSGLWLQPALVLICVPLGLSFYGFALNMEGISCA